jgi:hypothetical protein
MIFPPVFRHNVGLDRLVRPLSGFVVQLKTGLKIQSSILN